MSFLSLAFALRLGLHSTELKYFHFPDHFTMVKINVSPSPSDSITSFLDVSISR